MKRYDSWDGAQRGRAGAQLPAPDDTAAQRNDDQEGISQISEGTAQVKHLNGSNVGTKRAAMTGVSSAREDASKAAGVLHCIAVNGARHSLHVASDGGKDARRADSDKGIRKQDGQRFSGKIVSWADQAALGEFES